MYALYQVSVRQATISLSLLLAHTSQCKPWESLWGSSATTPLVDFHHRLTACPSYIRSAGRNTLHFLFVTVIFSYHYHTLHYMIEAPNGIRASFASLKCCNPNGIPITVMHNKQPNVTCSNASGIPDTRIHIIFTRNETVPPPYTISFPNGKNDILANLKH